MHPSGEGTDDRLKSAMFEDGNRIKFTLPVDTDGRAWWFARFYQQHGLTPEDMGDLLTKSAPGDKSMTYAFIDGVGKTFRVRIDGSDAGAGEIWLVERTFELTGNFFNADEMFVSENRRQRRVGRLLMGDLIKAGHTLNIARIKVQARNIGRYAWLRMGFRVDVQSWQDMRKNLLAAVLDYQDSLGAEQVWRIMNLISTSGPEMANAIAAMEEPVPSRQLRDAELRPLVVPLGKALMLERVGDWSGEFDLTAGDSQRIAEAYLLGDGDA